MPPTPFSKPVGAPLPTRNPENIPKEDYEESLRRARSPPPAPPPLQPQSRNFGVQCFRCWVGGEFPSCDPEKTWRGTRLCCLRSWSCRSHPPALPSQGPLGYRATRPPGDLGAELGHCAPSGTMNRCPRRCRSPLGQAARSLYQLVTGSLSPGMRKGGRGWTPE